MAMSKQKREAKYYVRLLVQIMLFFSLAFPLDNAKEKVRLATNW